jgi:hypothetical protein
MASGSTTRDVILTTQFRSDFDALAPFVWSLRRTGYSGRVVVFTSQVDPAMPSRLRQHGCEVAPFRYLGRHKRQPLALLWPLWQAGFASPVLRDMNRWLAHRVFPLVYRRYLLYADYLQQKAAQFDWVLLADSRDVFFQRDPFAWHPAPGLHVVLEEEGTRIGHCAAHRSWMRRQFREAYVNRHAEQPVSCSGTTFGDTASIRHYLAQMVAATMSARNLAGIGGGDQGIHNYLLIEKLLPNVTVHPNRRGPVLTMAVMRPGSVRLNPAGQVVNDNGEPVSVLHQYDRHPEISRRLLATLI